MVIFSSKSAHINKTNTMAEIDFPIATPTDRQKLFVALYKSAFPAAARYVSKMGGTFDEAKDIFQDALVIYYEKAAAGTITLNGSEQAYLLGISKNLWLKKFKENNRLASLHGVEAAEAEEQQASESKLMNFLETTGKKCMELLRSFYYDQLPLSEAAKLFGFSGTRSATVQKYKCLEKVRETVKEKSLTYEDFLA